MTGQYSGSYTKSVDITVTSATLEPGFSMAGGVSIAVYSTLGTNSFVNFATIDGGANLDSFGVILEGSIVSVTNEASGTIKVDSYGLGVRYATGTIVNAGTIEAVLNKPFSVPGVGPMIYGALGVSLDQSNVNLSNLSGGLIQGALGGIEGIGGGGTITNDGIIRGGYGTIATPNGVIAYHDEFGVVSQYGGVTNASGGTIGGFLGVSGRHISILNDGLITGSHWGVYDIYATISNQNSAGSVATISGGAAGIQAQIGDTVINDGVVLGTAGAGIVLDSFKNLYITAKPSLDNQAGGTIEGTTAGLYVKSIHDPTLTNAGLIEGMTNSEGIKLLFPVDLQNTGTITGASGVLDVGYGVYYNTIAAYGTSVAATVERLASAPSTLVNKGTIDAALNAPTSGSYGVLLRGVASISNFGLIEGGARGIAIEATRSINAPGYILNAGTITGAGITGVQLDTGGTLVNGGTITGGYYAAVVFNDASVADRLVLDIGARFNGRVLAHGTVGNVLELTDTFVFGYGGPGGNTTVYGLGNGINGFNTIQIDNAAHWTLAAGAGNSFTGGVSLGTSAGLTNGIAISGVVTGIGGDIVQNANQIIAPTAAAYAVLLNNSGEVFNSGTIAGGQRAVGINGTYGLIDNSGTIEGGHVVGIQLGAGGTVRNSGTIIGGYYAAVVFNDTAAADRLIVDPGASFSGQVLAHGATAVIELGSGSSHGTIAGFSNYTGNFHTLQVDAGAHWEINGNFTGGVSIGAGAYLSDLASLLVGTAGVTVAAGARLLGLDTITAAANAAYAVELQGGYLGILRGQVTGGQRVIGVQGTPATILNDGTIEGGHVVGIQLGAGGSVTNGGTILGGYYAAIAAAARATISNSYIIDAGTADAGAIRLNAGGVVDNAGAVARITGGAEGVAIYGASGTVQNSGTISGTVTGVVLGDGGTLTNAGSIAAGTYAAVVFNGGAATDRLIVDPGARFGGRVIAHGTVASTLEFAAGSGTLSGIGSSFTGFSALQFDSGAAWTVAGTYTGFDSGQTIQSFAAHDTLILDGFAATTHTYVSGIGLELGNATGNQITLDIPGTYLTGNFIVTDPPGNTTISVVPCFAETTRILTMRGEVPVEQLTTGDTALLHDGTTAPITWIGHRTLDCTRHPNPDLILPVLIEAGALATGIPCRDLLLSPDHAILLQNHLIPAKTLINGATIRQIPRRSITYYHVELAHHAALLAEATPCESYLDTGNRGAFANAGTPVILHPDLAQTLRETTCFAPFTESGPIVEAVRAKTLARASIATTTDPNLRIRYENGAAIIESRSAIPGHLTPDPRDRRTLGVKIAELRINGAKIPLDHPKLTQGWHDPEPDGRWTDGHAIIPASLANGQSVTVTLIATTAYPAAGNVIARPRGGQSNP